MFGFSTDSGVFSHAKAVFLAVFSGLCLLGSGAYGQFTQVPLPAGASLFQSINDCPDVYSSDVGESCAYFYESVSSQGQTIFSACPSICVDRNSYCINDENFYHAYVSCDFNTYQCSETASGLSVIEFDCAEAGQIENSGGCIEIGDPICEDVTAPSNYQNELKAECNFNNLPEGTICRNNFGNGTCDGEGGCYVPFEGCTSDADCEEVACASVTCDITTNGEGSASGGTGGSGAGGNGVCHYETIEDCESTICLPDPTVTCGPCQDKICDEVDGSFSCVDKVAVSCAECADQICDQDTDQFVCVAGDDDNDTYNSCEDCDDDDPTVGLAANGLCGSCGDGIRDSATEECDGSTNCDIDGTCTCEDGYLAGGDGECYEIVDCSEIVVEFGPSFQEVYTCKTVGGADPAPGQEFEFSVTVNGTETVYNGESLDLAAEGIDFDDVEAMSCSLTYQIGDACGYPIVDDPISAGCGTLDGSSYLVFNTSDLNSLDTACKDVTGPLTGPTFDTSGSPWKVEWTCEIPTGFEDCSLDIIVPSGPVCQ